MEIISIFLLFVSLTSAREVEVKDQVFCAMDQLADLVEKQKYILEDLIEINKDYLTKNDYFSRYLAAYISLLFFSHIFFYHNSAESYKRGSENNFLHKRMSPNTSQIP